MIHFIFARQSLCRGQVIMPRLSLGADEMVKFPPNLVHLKHTSVTNHFRVYSLTAKCQL